ncbi:hypothetical protein FXW78_37960 [Rhodococcus opacus]|nr:hypothetical protein [Rhodococcus opacus]RZL75555.1 MAG: hypothetical protein EOP32_31200 [Rhodococcus sp. (in: high G+C Gram-positive bacteria)]
MKPPHTRPVPAARFDHPNPVSTAGVVPVMTGRSTTTGPGRRPQAAPSSDTLDAVRALLPG